VTNPHGLPEIHPNQIPELSEGCENLFTRPHEQMARYSFWRQFVTKHGFTIGTPSIICLYDERGVAKSTFNFWNKFVAVPQRTTLESTSSRKKS
jgi:hypothetical protein